MSERNSYERIKGLDHRYVWHPFTQMRGWTEEDPIVVDRAEGCFVRDVRGRWYLDGVSSLWVNVHGHRRAEIDGAVKAQLDKVAHSTMLGVTNVPAAELAERLVTLVQKEIGPSLSRVFYSDDGSTSVEVALKMAYQHFKLRGVGGKNTFISLEHAYHGDTLGAVSVGGIEAFHSAFEPLLFRTHHAPSPHCYRCGLTGLSPSQCALLCLESVEELLIEYADEICAVIIEPMVQGAGGMIVHAPGYLEGLRKLCTNYGVLLIADEVATGFGRTGSMFACSHEGVSPDILCLSKGITGGYLPLAATIATDEVYESFLGEHSELKTFFHGHSYTGNPLACAAAIASLDVFEKDDTIRNMAPKVQIMRSWLDEVSALPHVGDARGLGLMAGVELVAKQATKEPYPLELRMGNRACYAARQEGLLIRPLGDVVVLMPPLSISEENLLQMLEVVREAIERVTSGAA